MEMDDMASRERRERDRSTGSSLIPRVRTREEERSQSPVGLGAPSRKTSMLYIEQNRDSDMHTYV
jgi:hypothetical protein